MLRTVATYPHEDFRAMKKIRGFSLIELLVVIGIGVTVITIGLAWLDSENKRNARANLVSAQAMEMSIMARALQAYIDTHPGAFPEAPTGPVPIDLTELIAASLLPEDFSMRPSEHPGAPTSPLGMEYTLLAHKDGDWKGIVLTTGAPSPAALARVGMKNTAVALEDYSRAVVATMKRRHLAPAGVIAGGGTGIDLGLSGFSLDLADYLSSAPSTATPVALAGFKDHAATPPVKVEVEIPEFEAATGDTSVELASVSWIYESDAIRVLTVCAEGVLPTRSMKCIPEGTKRIDVIVVGGGQYTEQGPQGSGTVDGATFAYTGLPVSYRIGASASHKGNPTIVYVNGAEIIRTVPSNGKNGYSGMGGNGYAVSYGGYVSWPSGGGGRGLYGEGPTESWGAQYPAGQGGVNGGSGEPGYRTNNASGGGAVAERYDAGGVGQGDVLSRLGFRPITVPRSLIPGPDANKYGFGYGQYGGAVLMRFCSKPTPC